LQSSAYPDLQSARFTSRQREVRGTKNAGKQGRCALCVAGKSTLLFQVGVLAIGWALNQSRSHVGSTVELQLWQIVNLIGTPLLALLFLPPVIEDIQTWLRSRGDRSD
jgi:hypothetical protein